MNLTIQPGSGPLAFSYVRLSSKRQKDGDGHRRQTEATAVYCQEKGLVLDHSLEDIGISAYSGANRERGTLSRFLALVRRGQIPGGSHLVVESLDRLSREQVLTAFRTFLDILDAGITIHTTADNHVYEKEAVNRSPFELIISIAVMSRAHEESRMKIVRQQATWDSNRKKARETGARLTKRWPTWLRMKADGSDLEGIPHRVEIIKRIFKESEQGIGCDAIARRLNADRDRDPEKFATFGGGRDWYGGTVRAYLTSIAVRGHYQPCRMEATIEDGVRTTKRVADGDVITDYYPWIIDEDQWNRTWAAMDARRLAGPANLAGRKGSKIANLFGSLATCSCCGSPMNIRDRGQKRRNRAFFMCAGARAGICEHASQYVVETWEPAMLRFITELDLRDVDPIEVQSLENSVAAKKAKRDALIKRADNLLEMVAEKGSARARELAGEAERELEAHSFELAREEEALRRVRAASPPEDRQEYARQLMSKMANAQGQELYAIRASLQQSLREIIDWIRFGAGEVAVAIKGGRIGYVFKDGKLFRRVEDPEGLLTPKSVASGGVFDLAIRQ